MSCCYVEMRGKDGKMHSVTLDATRAYDAAEKATRPWSLLWWFNPEAIITVQRGEQHWRISQDRLRSWQQGR
jgi:hypothetical protein